MKIFKIIIFSFFTNCLASKNMDPENAYVREDTFNSTTSMIVEKFVFPQIRCHPDCLTTIDKLAQKISELSDNIPKEILQKTIQTEVDLCWSNEPSDTVQYLLGRLMAMIRDSSNKPLITIFRSIELFMTVARDIRFSDSCCGGQSDWRMANKFAWRLVDQVAEYIIDNYYPNVFSKNTWPDVLNDTSILFFPPSAFHELSTPPNTPSSTPEPEN